MYFFGCLDVLEPSSSFAPAPSWQMHLWLYNLYFIIIIIIIMMLNIIIIMVYLHSKQLLNITDWT